MALLSALGSSLMSVNDQAIYTDSLQGDLHAVSNLLIASAMLFRFLKKKKNIINAHFLLTKKMCVLFYFFFFLRRQTYPLKQMIQYHLSNAL